MKKDFNTNTELCVNLKTELWNDKRMETGKVYRGTIRRTTTSEPYHYDELFVFTEAQRSQPVRRNPHIYEGDCINVNQAPDGTIYPTLLYATTLRVLTPNNAESGSRKSLPCCI